MAVRPQAQKSSLPDHAEVIGDVVEGEAAEGSGLDEYGFTPEERAAFDSMKEGPQDSEGPAEPMPTEPEADPAAAAPDPAAAQVDPNAPPAPAPGPTEEDDDSPDVVTTDPKTGKVQKTINYGKHQRLMTKAQTEAAQIREQLNQERLNQAKLAERLQILNDALMAPAPADPAQSDQPENPMQEKTIDPAEDAIGALAQMQRRQIWLADSGVQAQEQVQERIEDQELVSNFERDIRTFTSRPEGQHFMGPDGAYQYLKNARLVQLGISLFDKDPTDPNERFTQQEISKMIEDYNAEERWVVGNALRTGKSPSMAVLKLAKTFGWRPPEAQPASAAQPGAKSRLMAGPRRAVALLRRRAFQRPRPLSPRALRSPRSKRRQRPRRCRALSLTAAALRLRRRSIWKSS